MAGNLGIFASTVNECLRGKNNLVFAKIALDLRIRMS